MFNNIHQELYQHEEWRQHSDNVILIVDDIQTSNISVDKISQFSCRLPEFRFVFNSVGEYYRCFTVDRKKVSPQAMREKLNEDIIQTCFIDDLQQQVKIRSKTLPDIKSHLNGIKIELELDNQEDYDFYTYNEHMTHVRRESIQLMLQILDETSHVIETSEEDLNETQMIILNHVNCNLIDHKTDKSPHLPIPVYSLIRSTLGVQFIQHAMLSMGRFEIEIDLTLKPSIRDCLYYARLIGSYIDNTDLQ